MTPTQIQSNERSKRFHAAIARKARPDAPLGMRKAIPEHLLTEPPAAPPPPAPEITPEVIEDWAERQKKIHGWFWMVNEARLPKIELIQKIVCRYFRVKLNDFLSERRTADVVYPRQIGMFLCKEFTRRSLPEIGRRFGGRDHTTVLHSVRKIELREKTDKAISRDLELLREEIKRAHP